MFYFAITDFKFVRPHLAWSCSRIETGVVITESLLQAGRVTRHLPWLRGLELVRRGYQRVLDRPSGWTMRIEDFDGDLKLDVDPREFIGVTLWHKPELFEKDERSLFCSSISPGSVVLDVGANIGMYSLLAARRGATVFAVEADPNNAARLKHHIALNNFGDRISVSEFAALDREGSITIYRNPNNCGGSSCYAGTNGTEIPARPIDDLNLPPIDICKMDIEGAETRALLGMRATLRRSPGMKLLVEFNPKVGHCHMLIRLLHAAFGQVDIIGGPTLRSGESPTRFCDLACSQLKAGFDWSFADEMALTT